MRIVQQSTGTLVTLAALVCVVPAQTAQAAVAESVQSGTTTSTGNGVVTVTTTTSFDPSKTFLIFQTRSSAVVPVGNVVRGRIPTACANPCDTIEFVRVTNETSTINIAWSIVTFASGVTVQRGEVTQSALIVDVPITSVGGTNQAFVTWSKTMVATETTWDDNDGVLGLLTSATNLRFKCDTIAAGHTIAWQVIQWTNAAEIGVQTGTTAMTNAQLSVTATIPTPVNINTTFVLAGLRSSGSGVTAGMGAMMLRAELTNTNTITFTRGTLGTPAIPITEIVWQAIELKDSSAVIRPPLAADITIAEGQTSKVVTLLQEVDPSRSIAFGSVQGGGGQNMGSSVFDGADADLDIPGVATATIQLTKPNEVTLTRNYFHGTLSDVANIAWFVVQFNRGPGYGVKTGSFRHATTAGNQVIAHGLGEQPVGMIVWTGGNPLEGWNNPTSGYLFSFGVTDGTTSRAISAAAQDTPSSSNTARRISDRLLSVVDWTSGTCCGAEASLVSWDDTHMTVNWVFTTNPTQYITHYIIFGGSGVQAKVVQWQMPVNGAGGCTTPNACDKVVAVGFEPDLVLHAHAGDSMTAAPCTAQTCVSSASSATGLGVMDAFDNQWALAQFSTDNNSAMDSARSQRASDDGLATPYSAFRAITAGATGTVTKNAIFKTMDAVGSATNPTGGFTLKFDIAAANAGYAFSLALKGVTGKPMSIVKPAASGTQLVDTVGFQPAAVMFMSTMLDSQLNPQTHGRLGIGAGDGFNEGSSAFQDTNATTSGNANVDRIEKVSKVFMKLNQTLTVDTAPTNIDAEADLIDFDSSGYSLNWTVNGANDGAPTAIRILTVAFGINSPGSITAVEMTGLKATRYDNRVLVDWKTGYEVNNLGFNVYRQINDERTLITRSLIAGSGLMAGQGAAMRGEQHYAFWDMDPRSADPSAVYWLEDLDFKGARKLHGPITPVEGGLHMVPEIAPSSALRDLGKRLKRRGKIFSTAGARLDSGSKTRPRAVRTTNGTVPLDVQTQRWLAAQDAIKIGISQAGWYRVTQADLIAAGMDPQADPQTLRLFVDGVEQTITVTADAIEFYAIGADTPYTDTRIYWLVAGGRAGQRIAAHGAAGKPGGANSAASFPFTLQQKERSVYFAALRNGDEENWFGAFISEEPTDLTVDVSNMLPGAAAQIDVTLQGVTSTLEVEPDHQVAISVNGTEVGVLIFDGQAKGSQTFPIPSGVLTDGANRVTIVSRGSGADYSLVDVVRINYPHLYRADADVLRFTAEGPDDVTVAGFATRSIRVVDVTDPSTVEELRATVRAQDGLWAVTIRVPSQGVRTLLAFTDATIARPAFVHANAPSQWSSAANGADYVAVMHARFAESVAPLLARRVQRGFTVAQVDIEDVYDEFSFGEKTPQALKEFVTYARTQWKKAPRFLTLVGDATLDPRDYAGFGDADFVPTKQIPMAQIALETASDDWFADSDNDGLPEVAVGRLPVRTPEQANDVVAKLLAYEDGDGAGWTRNVLLVADQNDGTSDFEASADALSLVVPAGYTVQRVFAGAMGGEVAAMQLADAVNRDGQVIVNYIGHGSIRLWGTDGTVLTSDTLPALWQNGVRLPFVIAMNCLNGFFHGIYEEESLAETLVRTAGGGAVAAWASSGLTDSATQARVNQELFRVLFGDATVTMGQAAAVAKRAITNPDVRRSWIFFGDPALKLKAPR